MIGDRNEPTGGVPSLTDGEIITLYQKYLHRGPDAQELASERENAMKYSAAGIEGQIADRGGNVPLSGVRGDETRAPLTIPAQIAGNVATMGPAAIVLGPTAAGPTGTIPALYGASGSAQNPGAYYGASVAPSFGGFSVTTLAIVAVVAGAAWYFVLRK